MIQVIENSFLKVNCKEHVFMYYLYENEAGPIFNSNYKKHEWIKILHN